MRRPARASISFATAIAAVSMLSASVSFGVYWAAARTPSIAVADGFESLDPAATEPLPETPFPKADLAEAPRTEALSPDASPVRASILEQTPGREASDPFALGGGFVLVDQHGRTRTERDPDGRAQLLFFGYGRCEAMCLMTLPEIGATVDLLAEKGHAVRPVMITIDPEGDTPEALQHSMADIHPEMVGLTGSPEALAAARRAFNVPIDELGRTPDDIPIYSHGLFIYLLDGDGQFLTLMPPILGPTRMAEIVAGYLDRYPG